MNTVNFAEWVKKNNQRAKSKAYLAYFIFLGIHFLCSIFTTEENRGVFVFAGQCLAAAAAADMSRYQWNRYLYISRNEIVFEETPISHVLRLHAFPIQEYFCYINKKMRMTAALLGISSVLAGILGGFLSKEETFAWEKCLIILCFGVVSSVSPFFVGLLKKGFFVYQSKEGTEKGFNHLRQALKGIVLVAEAIILLAVGLISIFLFWVFLGAAEQPAIDETKVVYRMYPYCISVIFMMIAGFGALWIGTNFDWNKKITRKMTAIIFGALFLAGVVIQIAEMHIYTEITDSQIVIQMLWNSKTYRIEDIEQFSIYDENDGIQMELVFYDGNSAKLVGVSMENSDLYDQNYYSEYNYIADYAEKLQKAGADGKIRDIEKLREDVSAYDSQLQEGLEKIIKIVSADTGADTR